MADSVHKRLVAKVFEILSGITKANGFRTDIGIKGFNWKATNWDENDVPGFDLRDPSTTYEDQLSGRRDHTVTLEITCALNSGSTSASMMHDVRDDVISALYTQSQFTQAEFPGFTALVLKEESKAIMQEDRVVCGVKLRYEMRFRTTINNPTAQR